MPSAPPYRHARFGPFEANLRSGELLRDGVKVRLQEQPFRVLAVLLERPGEVVAREELHSRLWPSDTFVDFEHGLNTAIKKLRQALDDSAETPRFVETLARRGYRLIAPVAVEPAAEALPASSRENPPAVVEPTAADRSTPGPGEVKRWLMAGIAGFFLLGLGYIVIARHAPAPERSPSPMVLAILPFHVAAGSEQPADLGVGLADDVTTHLANFEALRVRPTRAVLPYQGPSVDVRQAGRELEADSVLSGTVRKVGERYRVSVQLVRVGDGSSYWGESLDVAAEELPGLEDRITEKVVSALGIRRTSREKGQTYRRYTENAAAYEAYLRGRAHLVRTTEEGATAAVEAFEDALRLDPNYALAYAGLSMATADMHLRFAPPPKVQAWGSRALEAAARALALDPNLAEVHQALAAVHGKTEFEWDKVIAESRRALELNPKLELPYSYLGRAFYHLGLLEEAEKEARAALALDPENRTEPMRTLGITLVLAGRFAEAAPLLEEVQRMSGKPLSDYYLAQAYYYKGETSRAEAVLEELGRSSSASNSARARSSLASILAARGQRSRAAEIARTVTAGGYFDHHVAYGLGTAEAQLGRREQAVGWLRRAAGTGFPCHAWYARDPLLDPLRKHPDFERFMGELEAARHAALARYAVALPPAPERAR